MYKKLVVIIGVILLLAGCKGISTMKQYNDEEWGLHSHNIVLIDLTDDEILYAKNENQKTYPASLTKIMTVLVALENMTEETMVTTSDYTELYEEGASLAGFFPNDRVNSMDLLYGTMLPSGAEAALSLAENIAGSEKEFVRLMNKKAQELGMEETHFENVTGLHEPNHYTTVNDLSILLKEALKNPTFKEIFTTDRYSTHHSSKNIDGITFESRLISKLDSKTFKGGKFLGGKTGYTHEAGLCLASLATDGDKEYILITTGAEGNAYTEPFNILDAINLYERFFNQKA